MKSFLLGICLLAATLLTCWYLGIEIALSLTITAAILCIAWTICHRPKEEALGKKPEDKAKIREFLVLDIRANSQNCSWYIGLIGVISSIVAAHRDDFKPVLNLDHVWPFAFAFFEASLAILFIPAGYGQHRFKRLRVIWFRSVLCEQMVVIFTCYGLWNAFVALSHPPPEPPRNGLPEVLGKSTPS